MAKLPRARATPSKAIDPIVWKGRAVTGIARPFRLREASVRAKHHGHEEEAMRPLSILTAVAALAMLPMTAAAQSGSTAMPDTRGIDPDLVCFTVTASAADDARGDAESKAVLDSAASFYAGRIDTRFRDATSVQAGMAKLLVAFKGVDTDGFQVPCLNRYVEALRRIHAGATAVTSK